VLPVISLFSGSGGLDTGFAQAGFTPVLAFDNEPAACLTFKTNHPTAHIIRKDLSDVQPGYILDRLGELPYPVRPIGVIGGPPCQAFSMSNVFKNSDDPRAKLPLSYANILRDLNRAYELDFFVFENVMGLKHPMHAKEFAAFKQFFGKAGFTIFEGELDACNFGVAQVRKRVFLVGFNAEKYGTLTDFEFPNGNGRRCSVRDAIGHLGEPVRFDRNLTPEEISRRAGHVNHWCMAPRSKKFDNGFLKEGEVKGRAFRVLAWDEPSWTVAYGHREVHVHPSGKRRLSVYEAMLLQGYPPDYRLMGTLSDQIRLVSDAVAPPVAAALARRINEVLRAKARPKRRSRTAATAR
jgi:DNA (cytosine-5)-methyltransferase 1